MTASYSIYEDPSYHVNISPSSFMPSTASSVSIGGASGTRKRIRTDLSDRNVDSPFGSANPRWPGASTNSTFTFTSTPTGDQSPATFTSTRYRLSNGLDTPGQHAAYSSMTLDGSSDVDFRSKWTEGGTFDFDSRHLGPLNREGNGRKRSRITAAEPLSESWGQYVFRVAGTVAKGAWDFCKDTAFRGFAAGGGVAYDMTNDMPQQLDGSQSWLHVENNTEQRESTPVPGDFPEDFYDAAEGYEERPAKRIQVGKGEEWVMVQPPAPNSSTRSRRPVHARQVSAARRGRPSVARMASVSHAGSPSFTHDRTRSASFVSQRSPHGSPSQPQGHFRTPSASDVQKWSNRKQREDRQADASMRRLNAQLKAMIREGKEALATRVEIEDAPTNDYFQDEGFMDGEGDHHSASRVSLGGKRVFESPIDRDRSLYN